MNKLRASKSGRADTTSNSGTTPKIRFTAIGNIGFLKKVLTNVFESTRLKMLSMNKTFTPAILEPFDKVEVKRPALIDIKAKNQTMIMGAAGRGAIFGEIDMTNKIGLSIVTLSTKIKIKTIKKHTNIFNRNRLIRGQKRIIISECKEDSRDISMRILLTNHTREELVTTSTDALETMTTRNSYKNGDTITGNIASNIFVDIIKGNTEAALIYQVIGERSMNRPAESIFTAIHKAETIGIIFLNKFRVNYYRGIKAHFRRI